MSKVILVDDSSFIRELMSAFLTKQGHEIVGLGEDGNEGVTLYKERQPDIVFLDISMPNKSGKECLEEIMLFDPNAKVVMVSSLVTASFLARQ